MRPQKRMRVKIEGKKAKIDELILTLAKVNVTISQQTNTIAALKPTSVRQNHAINGLKLMIAEQKFIAIELANKLEWLASRTPM